MEEPIPNVKVPEGGNPSEESNSVDETFPLSPFLPEQTVDGSAQESSNDSPSCAVCGEKNARRCTNCRQISYCGKDHQHQHWKTHKENCYPVKIVDKMEADIGNNTSTTQGRGRTHVMVATRDIKQGESFFRENVILTSPGPWDSEAIEVAKGRPICVSCCEIIKGFCDFDDDDDEESTVRCSQCRWPVCNHFCETSKCHAEYECRILSSNKVSSMVLNQMPDYECILVLRALSLKENNPERWMRLMNLDAPLDEYFENESASVFINNSIKFVREICGLKQYPDSLIRRVASICFLNAFFNDDHPGDNGHIYKIASYIVEMSSSVAHSCVGNSEWAVIPSVEDQIRLRAVVPIQAGDPITIVYNSKHLSHLSTQRRQSYFKEHYFFTCNCSRCSDATELCSYVSAVKCFKESCEGYLVPADPSKSTTEWSCNVPSCGKHESPERVQLVLEKVSDKLHKYPYSDPMRGIAKMMGETKKAISTLKKLTNKSQEYLHPNHYLLLEAEWSIIQNCYYYIMNVKQWTPEIVDLMVATARKHLAIFNKIAPGYSRRRGYILYYLQAGLLETIRHGTSLLTKRKTKVDPEEHEKLKKAYTEMMSMRDEIVKIFSFKGQIKNSMEEELANLSSQDQPFISCLRFLEKVLDRSVEA